MLSIPVYLSLFRVFIYFLWRHSFVFLFLLFLFIFSFVLYFFFIYFFAVPIFISYLFLHLLFLFLVPPPPPPPPFPPNSLFTLLLFHFLFYFISFSFYSSFVAPARTSNITSWLENLCSESVQMEGHERFNCVLKLVVDLVIKFYLFVGSPPKGYLLGVTCRYIDIDFFSFFFLPNLFWAKEKKWRKVDVIVYIFFIFLFIFFL